MLHREDEIVFDCSDLSESKLYSALSNPDDWILRCIRTELNILSCRLTDGYEEQRKVKRISRQWYSNERNGSWVELQLSTTRTWVRIMCCGVKTLGMFYSLYIAPVYSAV